MRRAALVALLLLSALAAAAPVAAAGPTFGEATAVAKFLESITVEQSASLPSGVHRVEAYVRVGGSGVTFLAEVPNPGSGEHVLHYVHPTPSGAVYPNTRVQLGFRVTLDDGQVVNSPPATIRYKDTRFTWNTIEGDLVRVHWYAGTSGFGTRALQIGEKAVKEASDLLGVTETDPIDYFIYADTEKFYDVLGPAIHENVGGIALPEIRTLFANIAPSDVDAGWVGIVVPHELTHLVFNTAVENPYRFPPRWLNEGLAVYLSEGYGSGDRNRVADAVDTHDLIPLEALGGQFPTDPDKTSLAYAEAVSAIDYLVSAHGRDALIALVLAYKDGLTDDEAFTKAIDQDLATFQAGWLDDLGATAPERFGPQPAPAGPLPSGWSGPVPSTGAAPGAPTTRPGTTAAPDGAPEPTATADAATLPLLFAGLGLVVGAVVVGLVVARRRGVVG